MKLHKSVNKTGTDLLIGLCKTAKVEAPSRDAPNALELAINAFKPAFESRNEEMLEFKERFATTLKEKIESAEEICADGYKLTSKHTQAI